METKNKKPNKLRNLAYVTAIAASLAGFSHGMSTDTVESKNLVYKDFVSYGGSGEAPEYLFYSPSTKDQVSVPVLRNKPEEMEKGKTYTVNFEVPNWKIFPKRPKSIEDIK